MRWMPRLRMLFARRPWIYWLFTSVVAGVIVVQVVDAQAEVRSARDSWGMTTTVFVARAEIRIGEPIGPAVSARQYPRAVVPATALHTFADAAIATRSISAGEILTELDISHFGGPLALLPDDWLAITIDGPVDGAYAVGDHAAILANGDLISAEAVVIRVLADAVMVGVPAEFAPAVAHFVAQRLAVIALSAG